ncbi:MAG: hypothetical protein O2963_04215 [Proteobacteria bacterium]|nr:hypothetical protein [Pseudomonadota bacterium]
MFIVLLKFSDQKDRAPQFMVQHKDWIKHGFDEGMFLMSGSLKPNLGGVILATNVTLADLHIMVNKDAFVSENIVSAEIIEISASRACEELKFLVEGT